MAEVMTETRWVTAEEFAALPDDGRRLELVHGEVVEMARTGMAHTVVALRLAARLAVFVEDRALGAAGGADAACWLERDPDTVRIPDGAYWSAARLPAAGLPPTFSEVVPDLVIEVVSQSDPPAEMLAKAGMWLQAGVRVVWVVWPETREIQVFRSATDITRLRGDETLSCDDLLPGFELPLDAVFAGLPAAEEAR